MRPTNVARSGMPEPKHYVGGVTWEAPSKRVSSTTVRITQLLLDGPSNICPKAQSPFRQKAMAGAFSGYIFNGYRRIASNVPYFIVPVVLGLATYSWGKSRYDYVNSKAGHEAAMKHGGHH
ncbi:hypothetical protein Clacol_008842 [Clathrus columnatus]|uniref:Cytochrome b-c1 complex subunit 8 n=1 Tax=Clathrus columnatus TaxID=1419009 RepID=A0AAV5ALL7_9AGAM|nr:hypothetical protein Clacol_008842 [Clathrus columnatus]